MGSFDGAEICELVGIYILNHISDVLDNSDVGLYRDDGLAVIHNSSTSDNEDIKKLLCTKFTKDFNLKITAEANLNTVDYLDVTLNLHQNSYKPYRKPDDNPIYINAKSNHPPMIFKEVPKSVNKRICSLSSSEHSFDNAIPTYKEALTRSGYSHNFTFDKNANQANPRRQHKRNVIWYNPPYSKHVSTNVGREFFKLLDHHFPKASPLHALFNRNKVKLSYSCMENVQSIISTHNKKILATHPTSNTERSCNCPQKSKPTCPMSGHCLTKNIIYKASVIPNSSPPKQYIGLASTTFKERLGNHTASFKNEHLSSSTELSKFIWSLKQKAEQFKLKWSIIQKATPYNPSTKRRNLCLAEKYHILIADKDITLNKRSELVSKCRHKRKYKLSEFSVT